jgi:hypothetical protein
MLRNCANFIRHLFLASAFSMMFHGSVYASEECIQAQAQGAAQMAGSLTAATQLCRKATPMEVGSSRKEAVAKCVENWPCAKDSCESWYDSAFDQATQGYNGATDEQKNQACTGLDNMKAMMEGAANKLRQ